MNYYFPILFLVPTFDEEKVISTDFSIAKRLWETTIFDLATLATKHTLHLPYQVMDVFLKHCNLELCVSNQESLNAAISIFQSFQLGLYTEGLSPFITPFITTHSINDYSGINSRESKSLIEYLDPALQNGMRSEEENLEAWPLELSFSCIAIESVNRLSKENFNSAVSKAKHWHKLKNKNKILPVVEDVAINAPRLTSLDQSLLHIWSGLETLFPNVGAELSFRIALYLAQLLSSSSKRMEIYERVRASYNIRSGITHGSRRNISMDDWIGTWSLLIEAINVILIRQKMPTENELLAELIEG